MGNGEFRITIAQSQRINCISNRIPEKDLRDGIYVVYAATRFCIARCRIKRQIGVVYSIINAVKRGLVDLMKFAHENGADTTDGCTIAAESGHVECLRVAHQLGGLIWNACEYAAVRRSCRMLHVAHGIGRQELGFMWNMLPKAAMGMFACSSSIGIGAIGFSCEIAKMVILNVCV